MTYSSLKPGDKVSFGAPWFRTVATVSKPYDLNGMEVVAVTCTDGYAVEVDASLPIR